MTSLDAPGFADMPLFDVPAPPAPVRTPRTAADFRPASCAPAGRSSTSMNCSRYCCPVVTAPAMPATSPNPCWQPSEPRARVLAARPDRLRTLPGLSEAGIAAIKAAEALGIRMARAAVPEQVRPSFGNYAKVIDYCRTLAGHREVEQFHLLFLDRKNTLISDEMHQHGTVCHTPVYPREICVRCLEVQASAVLLVHDHPSGNPEPSRADIDMTRRIRDALKTIEVTLLDHVIVTSGETVSFRERGLL